MIILQFRPYNFPIAKLIAEEEYPDLEQTAGSNNTYVKILLLGSTVNCLLFIFLESRPHEMNLPDK